LKGTTPSGNALKLRLGGCEVGLIRAFAGAVGGSLGDQWKDFLTVPSGVEPTAALFPAVPSGTNSGRGSNIQQSDLVITNGSKIVVPEGYGLITTQDGEITSFVAEAGGYVWQADNLNSQSIFADGGVVDPVVRLSWERFKFGGRPSAQQLGLFVSLKELPNNRFGTQSAIYWDDKYLNSQVGAVTRGTYSLQISDPIVFIKNFVPASYLQGQQVFDFVDPQNPVASQIFSEIVGCLAAAFSAYANASDKSNRIMQLQQDSLGFAASLAQVVEDNFKWQETRGLRIAKAALLAIDYDESTRELLKTVQRADALSGARGNSNLQASVASGIEAAGQTEGAAGLVGVGIAGNTLGLASLSQSGVPAAAEPAGGTLTRLSELKSAFEAGLITQGDYDAARAKILDI